MTKPTFRFPLPKTFRVSQTLKVWLLRRGVGLVLLLSVVAGLQLAAIGRAAADAPGPWPPPLPKSALPDTASRAAADTVDRAAATPALVDLAGLYPLQDVAQVVAGAGHTCALLTNGGVKCWGRNNYGQLGDGTITANPIPVDVVGLASGVAALSAGWGHTCALLTGGGVKCWGYNDSGQLGDGTTTFRATPVPVSGLSSGVRALAAGSYHTCALLAGGGVQCWGWNTYGQLGDGTTTDKHTPVAVAGLDAGVAALTAGAYHTCAAASSGGVACWGRNNYGQLGDGTTTPRLTPVAVSGLGSEVRALAAGGWHTCVLTTGGGVQCWGWNSDGQLGDGTTVDKPTPVAVQGLNSAVAALTAGTWHTCVVTTSGEGQCWGDDAAGQLGDGQTTDQPRPVAVAELHGEIRALAAGRGHTCAVMVSGESKCWGANDSGQLGDGTTASRLTPTAVIGLSGAVSALAAGYNHTCALTASGGVQCWGWNDYGQLGDGTTASRLAPTAAALSGEGRALVVGVYHTCALTSSGGVQCWGWNAYGQLGNGTTTRQLVPGAVTGLSSGVRALAAGWYHTCALTSGGGVRCWGWNGDGQLGDETTTNQLAPVAATGLESGITALAAGNAHTCALTTSGGVQCWGYNASGQLGDGTTTSRATPVAVVGLSSGVSALAAGASHTCALLTGGGIQCWGANGFGQLGDGTTTDSLTPVAVAGLSSGVSALGTQSFHTCALLTGGGVQCWGNNDFGQLGDGTTLTRLAPVAVTGLSSGVSALAVGYFHTCGVMHDGSAQCWGANDAGQLGDGIAWRTTPGDVLTACFALARSHTGAGADPTVAPARTIGCPPDLYAAGQALTLTASPAAGWRVAGWRGTAVDSRATLTNTLVMPAADASAAVDYVAVRYTVYLPVLFSDR